MDPNLKRWLFKIAVWIYAYFYFYRPASEKNRNGCAWWFLGVFGFVFLIVFGVFVANMLYIDDPSARGPDGKLTPDVIAVKDWVSNGGVFLAIVYVMLLEKYLQRLPPLERDRPSAARVPRTIEKQRESKNAEDDQGSEPDPKND